MIELYSTSTLLLSLISIILLSVLLAVCLKLFRLRKQLKKKDILAGFIFVPLFSTLFFLVATNTSKIIFTPTEQYTVIKGALVSTSIKSGKNQVDQSFLTVILKDPKGEEKQFKVSNILNPFSYTHTLNEPHLFNTIGQVYQVTLLDNMILKVEASESSHNNNHNLQ
jgi:hypothetical protein